MSEDAAPLVLIRGDATPEEVAALVAVLSAVTRPSAPAAAEPPSEWASARRAVRPAAGASSWRSSALPR